MRKLLVVLAIAAAVLMLAAFPSVASWPTVAQQPEYVTLAGSNGANDQIPEGTPSTWGQYGGSVDGWQNTPCWGQPAGSACAYTYGNPYVQVYAPAKLHDGTGGNPVPDVKVEICHMQAWTLDSNDVWHALYNPEVSRIGGAWFTETFSSSRTDGTYDRSVPGCLIVAMKPGYLYHGYPDQGRAWTGTDIHGLVAAAEMRILPGSYDPAGPTPNLIADSGFDFWAGASSGSSHTAGQGRLKTMGTGWRWYFRSTLTSDQLHAGLMPSFSFDPATMF